VGVDPTINPFWQDQLTPLRALLETESAPTLEALREALGYNDERLAPGARNRDRADWPEIAAHLKPLTIVRGELGEHVAALYFLKSRHLVKEYLADADRLGLASNMTLARHWWYARRLGEVLSPAGPRVFLEIGAGAGQFSRLMMAQGMVSHYVLVDLPEMLINSAINTVEAGVPLRIGERPDFDLAGPVFWLLEPSDIGLVPGRSIDVALNFNSFMEMDREVRDSYIHEIYRTCRPGGVFYNVNRRQSAMSTTAGEAFDNHPLLYPYRASQVIEWEPDVFQQSIRSSAVEAPRSFAISRIEVV
jgi:hypothetical protein